MLWDNDYADDLAITADTITKSTVPRHYLETAASDVGLDLTNSTTNLMVVIQHGSLQLLSVESMTIWRIFLMTWKAYNSAGKDM